MSINAISHRYLGFGSSCICRRSFSLPNVIATGSLEPTRACHGRCEEGINPWLSVCFDLNQRVLIGLIPPFNSFPFLIYHLPHWTQHQSRTSRHFRSIHSPLGHSCSRSVFWPTCFFSSVHRGTQPHRRQQFRALVPCFSQASRPLFIFGTEGDRIAHRQTHGRADHLVCLCHHLIVLTGLGNRRHHGDTRFRGSRT